MNNRLRNREKQISDRWVVMIDDESFLIQVLERKENYLKIECDNREIELTSSMAYW